MYSIQFCISASFSSKVIVENGIVMLEYWVLFAFFLAVNDICFLIPQLLKYKLFSDDLNVTLCIKDEKVAQVSLKKKKP